MTGVVDVSDRGEAFRGGQWQNLGLVAVGAVGGAGWGLLAKRVGLMGSDDSIFFSSQLSREWGEGASGLSRWRHADEIPVNFVRSGGLMGGAAVIGQATCGNPILHPGCPG